MCGKSGAGSRNASRAILQTLNIANTKEEVYKFR